jgi:CIC family chloride channel protein
MPLAEIRDRLRKSVSPKTLAIFEACLIGLVSGLSAVLLKQGVEWLGTVRLLLTKQFPVWLVLPAIALCGAFLAGLLVQRVAPETAGSGIPQVKTALAGVQGQLDGRVAVVKLLGSMLTIASGLTLGRQGPTVQIGAALAAQLSRWVPTSPDYRRQLIACGAAAGLAAGFNAPIAGVLFVVEELIRDFSGITLGPAIIASFIGAVVSRILGGQSLNLDRSLTIHYTTFSVQEIPFYLLLGILAGLLGVLFQKGIVKATIFYRRTLRLSLPLQMGLAGLICGAVVASLPELFRNNAGLREFLLTGEADARACAIAFVTHFVLTIIAAGSRAPGGLFAPSLVLGSALGYLIGLWQSDIAGFGAPTSYAFAGMGAFFCAVSRAPITGVVMIFEITTDFNLVLPLMIVSVVSYLVSEKVSGGSLYDELLALNGIDLKKEKPVTGLLSEIRAVDVMQRRVETLTMEQSLDEVLQMFASSHHRGFPVVNNGQLVGIVGQTDLAKIDSKRFQGDRSVREIMTPQPVTVLPEDTLSEVLYQLNRFGLSRLPVVDGRKLVGIITRTDIIRTESTHLARETSGKHNPTPSYVVYQTRDPAIGKNRILVPLANPETAGTLLKLAVAIAHEQNSELECLQVLLVHRDQPPSETPVRTTNSRRLLQQAVRLARSWGVPVHTQVRVTHDVAQAILDTIKERHIDLILMGWKGGTLTPGRIFGNVVDTVIRQAPCHVVLVKWSQVFALKSLSKTLEEAPTANSCPVPLFNRWLLSIGGGPNSQQALRLLPALLKLSVKPEVRLCEVFNPNDSKPDKTPLYKAREFLSQKVDCPIAATPIFSDSVPDVISTLADEYNYDVVVLGASREGLLQQVIKGNIPEEIARGCHCTVILVRSAIGT